MTVSELNKSPACYLLDMHEYPRLKHERSTTELNNCPGVIGNS